MGVSADVFNQIQDQLKDETPAAPVNAAGKPNPLPKAESGWSMTDSAMKALKETGSALAVGVTSGADFIKGMAIGSAQRAEQLGMIPPLPETGSAVERAFRPLLMPFTEELPAGVRKAAKEPETVVGKVLNPGIEGIGAMATMPILGPANAGVQATAQTVKSLLARNAISGFGMGEGAEYGGKIYGGIMSYFDNPGSDTFRKYGETVGSVAGGMLGAQAKITQTAGLSELVKRPYEVVKNVIPAYKSAREAKKAGDNRALWEIFADEMGGLRSTTRSIIEDYTNAELASAIRRDIHATANVKQFGKDAEIAKMEMEVPMKGDDGVTRMVKPWGLGEYTAVPEIALLSRERVPKTFSEGIDIKGNVDARREAIRRAYTNLAGGKIPATEEGAQAAGEAFRQLTQSKINALSAEQGAVQAQFPNLSQGNLFQIGEKARDIRDARAKEYFGTGSGKYEQSFNSADAEGGKIKLDETLKESKDILKEFYVKIDPRETLSPVISDLVGAMRKDAPPAIELFLPPELAAERAAKAATEKAKPLSLREANDLVRALGNAAGNALKAEQYGKYNRARELQQTVLDEIGKSKLSDATKALFDDARAYWGAEVAPRFLEGMGKALGKERGGVMEGREAVMSEDVMAKFLADRQTGMEDFVRIYGNDANANALLNTTLQSRFRNDVLLGAKTPAQVEKNWSEFQNQYSPALERFPQTAQKMDAAAAKTMELQSETKRELDRFNDITGGVIGTEIGHLQAKIMYQRVLADPLKMEALLKAMPSNKGDAARKMVKEVWIQANPMKDGHYDPEAITTMLNAGSNSPAVKASMERLFEAAFGKEEGKRHWEVLNAIAGFTAREAMTAPRNMRSGELLSESPIKGFTGQSAASWISAGRAVGSGQAGGTYFTMLGLSRFANAKAQAAVENAKLKALYDPDTAKAILELAATPTTQPLGLSTAKKIFGNVSLPNGQNLVDRLIDRGYVKKYLSRGAIYGMEQSNAERDR